MQAHLDKDLRVTLPLEIVQQLGLVPNSTVELTVQGKALVLEPVREESGKLVLEGKLLVYKTTGPQPEVDLNEFIEQMRDERIREQGGW